MTPEIKDEWVYDARDAYENEDNVGGPANFGDMKRAIEAIAPAIYEAGLRAGLEKAAAKLEREANREASAARDMAITPAMAGMAGSGHREATALARASNIVRRIKATD